MRIPIDRDSKTPVYQQIEGHLRAAISSGQLAPGSRLPSTRALARDLGVNRITVDSAYSGLEADGLILTRPGSGTYVLEPPALAELPRREEGAAWPLWQQALADESGTTAPAPARPGLINLAGGSGDARQFPVEDYRRVIQAVLRRDGMDALGYGDMEGYPPLRRTIAQILASQGIPASPESVLVTAGSQQAIALVSQLLLQPGDTVLVESPTYSLALDLFRAHGLKIASVPLDEQGMQVDLLERALQQHHPRLIYTIPNFHNPTGVLMSAARRRQLIALADRYNLPVLEDDYVGDLRFEGRALPALKSLDPGGGVIYASTFSKMLMPGLRIGFLVADGPVYRRLVNYKRLNDLTTSNLHQHALEAYVTVGRYQAHLRRTVQLYRSRRDALVVALRHWLPEARFSVPQGGLFFWLRLPGDVDAGRLLPLACAEGVSYLPGSDFFPEASEPCPYLRLNFSNQTPEALEEGVRRLAQGVKKYPHAGGLGK